MGLSRVTGLVLSIRLIMKLLPHIYDAFHWNAICLVPESYDAVASAKEMQEKWNQLPSSLKELADSCHQLHARMNEFKALAVRRMHFVI
jgi:hypothetical protein